MLNDDPRQRTIFDITANNHGGNEHSDNARRSINASEIRNKVLDYIQQREQAERERILKIAEEMANAIESFSACKSESYYVAKFMVNLKQRLGEI